MTTKPAPRKAAVATQVARRTPASKKSEPGSVSRVAGQIIDAQKGLIQAGLRAVMGKPETSDAGKPGSWRLGSLEDVFDQRIAAALQRIGIPTVQQVKALTEQIERLNQRLAALEKRRSR